MLEGVTVSAVADWDSQTVEAQGLEDPEDQEGEGNEEHDEWLKDDETVFGYEDSRNLYYFGCKSDDAMVTAHEDKDS